MASVRELLKSKENPRLLTIGPDESVLEAIRRMSDEGVGSLMVVDDEDQQLSGIITERDYARKMVLEGRSSPFTSVREIMRTRVRCVGPDATIDECRAVMTEDNIRYVPVVDERCLVGLVSIGDVVAHDIAEKDFLIDQLTVFVTSSSRIRMRQ